ncbi:MAG: porin [Rhodospirillaceae bacterium]|jgi:hypothetical protein|nr:porin [Rhodospirillaceae bacterium]
MKKVLFFSSVLFVFSDFSIQAATPIKLSLSGTLVENFGYASNNDLNSHETPENVKLNKFHAQHDGTVSIKGESALDNGIIIAVKFDLYGSSESNSRSANGSFVQTSNLNYTGNNNTNSAKISGNPAIKRAYVTINTRAGSLILGEREDATYIVHTSAPDVSPLAPIGDGYFYSWVASPKNHRTFTADNDSHYISRGKKITYISPSFHGLAAVFTYVPSISNRLSFDMPSTSNGSAIFIGNGQVNGANYGGNAYGGGLAYSDTLRGVGIKADSTIVKTKITNMHIYQHGLQLSYAGFTLGGSSLIRNVQNNSIITIGNVQITDLVANEIFGRSVSASAFAKMAMYAGNSYTVGLSYAIGSYSFSFAFFHDNSKSIVTMNGTGKSDSTNAYDIGIAYTAGPGVIFRIGCGYVNYCGSIINNDVNYLNNNSGVVALTGVKLDF